MRARQNDREWLLHPEVALRGEFQEFGTTEWLRKMVHSGMIVFDVGANVGQVTMESAELVGREGRVVAIEPGSGNLQLLRRHLEANGFSERVTVVEGVCSDRTGIATFSVVGQTPDSVGSGHTLAGENAVRRQGTTLPIHHVEVQAHSIDDLCQRLRVAPDVIKIDVEGAELSVLRGAKATLQGARPALWIGFHPFAFDDPVAASDELRALLNECGYVLNAPQQGGLELDEYEALPAAPRDQPATPH